MTGVKVAAVQAAPVFFDLEASIDKAIQLAREAKAQGCALIAFAEAWLPGYPFQIWLGAPAWSLQFTERYMDNSLVLGSPQHQRLEAAARDIGIHIAMGYSERAGGSLYLGQCLIDDEGRTVQARRKLKPTHVERSIFGEGYGEDLSVVDTALGRIGALCCWEHLQPLSKYALYSQGEQIHIAAWPAFSLYRPAAHALGQEVNMAASRVYAVEGQCFVIAATNVVDQAALDRLKVGTETPPFLEAGGGSAMIFGPDGRNLADFLPETAEGLVIAELDFGAILRAKAIADPAGHYAKPEATRLLLTRAPRRPVVTREEPETEL
jgi:aliphatic nitrilase